MKNLVFITKISGDYLHISGEKESSTSRSEAKFDKVLHTI